MRLSKLGSSELMVSRFAFGSMSFGEQTTAESAFALLDQALDNGINLLDCAEMYPAPARAETYGAAERIIGQWLSRSGQRDGVVLATKAAGPAAFVGWIRNGSSHHIRANLQRAVDDSLARLQTDTIDLYQLHWPDRAANYFGQLGFKAPRNEAAFDMAATLQALAELVQAGKIRYVGLCNETAWGAMRFMQLARAAGGPPIVAVQNPYNLLNRSAEVGLAEVCWREALDFIAYSPLACGLLTGKYSSGEATPDARLHRYTHYRRYRSERAMTAAARYVDIARDAGLDPAHMALAWCASKPWVSSVIIGATSAAQLSHNLAACELQLPRAVDKAIDQVHEEISNPCP